MYAHVLNINKTSLSYAGYEIYLIIITHNWAIRIDLSNVNKIKYTFFMRSNFSFNIHTHIIVMVSTICK